MKISSESIESIKCAADIVAVVSEYISLTKKGKTYFAFCPFEWCVCNEIPFFVVSPEFQIYKCFCCGSVGDPIKFIMDIKGISYVGALRNLADKFQIEIIEDNNDTL